MSLLTQPKISSAEEIPVAINDQPPSGTVKSILPCTPLAIVKCLEHAGVYNRILPYGDRAYGRIITVINRWAIVSRGSKRCTSDEQALGLRWSDDHLLRYWRTTVLACSPWTSTLSRRVHRFRLPKIEPQPHPQEYTKRPTANITTQNRFNRHHVANPSQLSLEECLAISDVVVSAVPSANYKIKTESLRQGCVCLNIASEKNFDKDVREKVR